MAWLRIDDGMPEHHKLLGLPRKDRWTWMELLCYVARQGNGGHVPTGVVDLLRYVTPAFLEKCVRVGLLDQVDDGLAVHDWSDYNPDAGSGSAKTAAEEPLDDRVRDAFERLPGASANDIAQIVRGRRKDVLDAIKRYREVPGNGSAGSEDQSPEPAGTGSRAGTRARTPSPTPEELSTAATFTGDAAAAERLAEAGWTQSQIHRAADGLPRAIAWLDHATADPTCTSPGALAWTKHSTGTTWPEAPRNGTGSIADPNAPVCPHCDTTIRPPTTLEDHIRVQHADYQAAPPPAELLTLAGRRPAPSLDDDDGEAA